VPGLAADDVFGVDAGHPTDRVPGAIHVQAPRGFRTGPQLAAYGKAECDGFAGADTSSCMERFSSLPELRIAWARGPPAC
jgi:2-C-methyl-D-erythritol 4-phosphate cytidylyltransferase